MYKPTIGLEIHVELNTNSKMFCSCKNDSEEVIPNLNICPVCMGHPGTLPVINKKAVREVIKTAQALNCQIQKETYFERKNYFYPDLPKGYQISQYIVPLSKNGYLEIPSNNPKQFKKIRITRIHLEEDTGKLIHPKGTNYSLIDFNRAGIPLMELVTEPDITSSQETRDFVKQFQLILRYLKVSDADMEKGQMRVEVNISLNEERDKEMGTKVEIKNLNSLKSVEKAIDYETKRQIALLEKNKKVIQETRGWHDEKKITFSQRKKEESHDYRYFPEPDLPPLELSDEFLEEIKKEIPELPQLKKERFKKEYYLLDKEADFYISQKELSYYFEQVVSELRNWVKEKKFKERIPESEFKKLIKLASNYISSDLQGLLKGKLVTDKDFLISPENFAEFCSMIYLGEISSKIAKSLLLSMFETGQDPSQIISEKGLRLITSESEIESVVREVINDNEKAVTDYKKSKENALQFLIGKVMAKTKGTANPETVQKLLKKLLK
jgi:aspartyl-tRNA(Asn)/glutamyl-tRNA(Gln) amidotransferase subunit B